MRRQDETRSLWVFPFFLALASLIILFDQLTKSWVRTNLALGESIPPTGFFRIVHLQNTGAAFGMLQGFSPFLTLVSIGCLVVVISAAILVYRHFPARYYKWGLLTLAIAFAGSIGNLIDRLSRGYVTDFVGVGIWPPFNVADSAILGGIISFACIFLFLAKVRVE